MKVLIVGGVAGGASAAARLRRLNEEAQIVMFERGPYISFANCGLPYHLGKVIPERESLLVMSAEGFRARFNVDVRTRQEVTAIDRAGKKVTVKNLETGESYEEDYDRLVLATGSSPVRPPLPGDHDPDLFQLWSIPDLDRIMAKIDTGARQALVIGGGFIGLEAAENLRRRGLEVTLVEMMPQVLPTIDAEMSVPLQQELQREGIRLRLGAKVTAFERNAQGKLEAQLDNGDKLAADFALLSVGVKPNSELAKNAGLELNARGGIVVDDRLRTADPAIYAVGDVIEVTDPIGGGKTMIPLAGPASRQGRIAAENLCGRDSVYRGSLGTSVVKIGNLTAASVGWTERRLRQAGSEFEKIYLHPGSHAGYYPGAAILDMKVIFDRKGHILGAQVVGARGVDKRIDVIAAALRGGMTVYQLEELELAYAPPYGSARDPVNLAGMIAANVLRGDSKVVHADALPADVLLLDVREEEETVLGMVPGAVNIPLGQLRQRSGELPRDRQIAAYCRVGLRGYVAERMLRQQGFEVANLSGGFTTWKLFHPDPVAEPVKTELGGSCCAVKAAAPAAPGKTIDVRALQCPGPVVRMKQEIDAMADGETLTVLAVASFRPDLEAWLKASGNELLEIANGAEELRAVIRKGGEKMEKNLKAGNNDSAAIVLFSNDLDKAMAAFIIATGMAAAGAKVSMFFTFWGLSVLRKDPAPAVKKDVLSRMFGWMLPRGARKLALSKMNMGGMGTAMMKYVMDKNNVTPLPQLIADAKKLGVKFIACEMAMNVMGLQREELIDDIDEIAGVASFAGLAKDSGTTLFI